MATSGKRRTILRDPYHAQIVERLSEHLDREKFERCIGELWHVRFPGLVPVIGGSDQGWDGEIADGEGEPYQLICTTSEEFSAVKNNLVSSLRAARENGWPRRKAALAVSTALTPGQRAKLFNAARSEGFTLIELADREGLADLLYRNAKCCRELLGLSGQPRALSLVPMTPRPFSTIAPIGRDEDLDWLRQTVGDRVLSGQPGAGKTLLLRTLAREGRGLFLVSDSQSEIANELRARKEDVTLFVDDAHLHLERIHLLVGLRATTGLDFTIVATSWPGDAHLVGDQLGGLPEGQIRTLEPLRRDEIVEVYHRLGVFLDDDEMRLLVDQAANKPGLAATIAQAWRSGDRKPVLTGETLCNRILATLQRRTGTDPALPLAVLALVGDGGMTLEEVSSHLGCSELEMSRELGTMEHAGILQQDRSRNLSVVPPDLRAALIRKVFFSAHRSAGRPAIDWKRLVADPSRLHGALFELIRATHRDAPVPRRDLEDLILRGDEANAWRMRDVWRGYALLGADEAKWVLEHYPREVVDVAGATLRHAATATIPRLLDAARTAEGSLHHQPNHPLRILHDWMRGPPDSAGPGLFERRSLVLRRAKEFIATEQDRSVAIHAMTLALDPSVEFTKRDPGLGSTLTIHFGLLRVADLRRFPRLWLEMRGSIEPIDAPTWWHLESALRKWAHLETVAHGQVEEEEARVAREFVRGVVTDLLPSTDHPGLARALERIAGWVDLTLAVERDHFLELLFPEHRRDAEATDPPTALVDLATQWSRRAPADVVDDLRRLSSEARFLSGRGDLTTRFCDYLAKAVERPEDWFQAFFEGAVGVTQLSPFLARCVRERRPGWDDSLERCLDAQAFHWAALEQILTMPNPPESLRERAIAAAGPYSQLIETLCSRRTVPPPQLETLLESRDVRVSLAAAAGEWEAEPGHRIQAEVRNHWRRAVLRIDAEDLWTVRHTAMLEFFLGEILRNDPVLATEWLRARVSAQDPGYLSMHGPAGEAIRGLSGDQRVSVLEVVSDGVQAAELVRHLVDGDVEVYRRLSRMNHLASFHLVPLHGLPNESWSGLAAVALESGVSPAEIAEAALSTPHVIASGEEVRRWEEFREAFSALSTSSSTELRRVGGAGVRLVLQRLAAARRNVRELEVRGF